MNQLFELKQLQPNNRGLVALKDLKAGCKIIQSEPIAWATLKNLKGEVCNWCLLRKETFRWYISSYPARNARASITVRRSARRRTGASTSMSASFTS